jgi:hypothetical protein
VKISYCRCNRSVDKILHQFLSSIKLINSFDRKLINFLLLLDEPIRFRFRTDWPIGNAQEVKINLNSCELINLRKWIHAIFFQHFHCIESKIKLEIGYFTTKPFLHAAKSIVGTPAGYYRYSWIFNGWLASKYLKERYSKKIQNNSNSE